ncbi:hypothetical protein GBA52_016868 [Prunus armeniaca]|nr:hypothetical protein GBA52_016868 [Prunus armeniaca]
MNSATNNNGCASSAAVEGNGGLRILESYKMSGSNEMLDSRPSKEGKRSLSFTPVLYYSSLYYANHSQNRIP